MPYTDNTFTTAKQDGPTEVRFPFLNSPSRDNTCHQYRQRMVVLPGSFTATAAGSTWPGDGVWAANSNIYLVRESDPQPAGGVHRFERLYSSIPASQNVYGSVMMTRPVMHDIKVGSLYAVSFDGQDSWVFNSRVSVSSFAQGGKLSGSTVSLVGSGSASFAGTDSESTIRAAFATAFGGTSANYAVTRDLYRIEIWKGNGGFSVTTTADDLEVLGDPGFAEPTIVRSRTVTETQTRVITTGSAHGGSAGMWMAAWNGDKLVGFTKPTAASGSSITVRANEAPWNADGLVITDVAFANAAIARYVGGPVSVSTREQSQFYYPGVTAGITTPYDIPLLAPKNDPVGWLTAISNSNTEVVVQGSQLRQWEGPIYVQTAIYGQTADALETASTTA